MLNINKNKSNNIQRCLTFLGIWKLGMIFSDSRRRLLVTVQFTVGNRKAMTNKIPSARTYVRKH